MSREWIVAIIAIICIVTASTAAIIVILYHNDRREMDQCAVRPNWCVELWNIRHGYKVDVDFHCSTVVGRYTLYNTAVQMQLGLTDTCISREHILLYEQNEALWVWNLSAVNPAAINGHRLNTPQLLVPGIRLELGKSVFLVTKVDQAAPKSARKH